MVRSTLLSTWVTPLPVKETESVGRVGSLLAIVSAAETEPAAAGVKRRVRSTDRPGITAKGTAGETSVKAAPLLVIERIVRSAVPLLPTVIFVSLIWPVVTAPKSKDAGRTEIDGARPEEPVPVRATVTVDRAGSELTIDKVPETDPNAFGEKRTVTSADCPTWIVTGSSGAVTPNRGLLLVTDLTVSGAVPLLLIVNLRSFVWPEITLSNPMDDAPSRITGTGFSKATPLNGTFTAVRLGSLLVRASVLCCDPAEVGVQRTAIARWPSGGITRLPPLEIRRNGPAEICAA